MTYKEHTYLECLYSIIQYQQEIIKRYEEYIENNIHAKIVKREQESFDIESFASLHCKRITIPQADIILKYDPQLADEWERIKRESPVPPVPAVRRFVIENFTDKI